LDGSKKIRNGGVFAAVMADFQNIGLQRRRVGFGKHVVLGKCFRVAGKKKTALTEFNAENQ